MKQLCIAMLLVFALAVSCQAASVTVVDQAGRTVVIEQPVKRVVTTFMPATLFALCGGLDDVLVGTSSRDSDMPVYRAVMQDNRPIHVGNRSMGLNMETLMVTNPDLVILYGQRDGRRIANLLHSIGIPAIIIKPESIKDMETTLELIAKATGKTEAAKRTLDAMHRVQKVVKDHLGSVKSSEKPEVYYAANSLMHTASGEMLQSKIISLAGGKSVSRSIRGFFSSVTQEQLLYWNPEYVIASGKVSEREMKKFSKTPLCNVTAAKNGNLYRLPEETYWDYPSPLSYVGVLWMAAKFHPDQFADVDIQQEVVRFYDAVFGAGFSQKHPEVAGLE